MPMPSPKRLDPFRKATTAQERAQDLDATRWFHDFGWPQVQKLAEHMDKYALPAGFALFDEGEQEPYLGIILAGRVRIDKGGEDGLRREICQLGPGKAFGEISLIDGQPRSARVATLESSEILVLTRNGLDRMADQAPKLAVLLLFKLGNLISGRLRATSGRLIDFLQE